MKINVTSPHKNQSDLFQRGGMHRLFVPPNECPLHPITKVLTMSPSFHSQTHPYASASKLRHVHEELSRAKNPDS